MQHSPGGVLFRSAKSAIVAGVLFSSALALAQIDTTPRLGGSSVALSELDLTLVDQQWNAAHRDQSVSGKPLQIADRVFAHGIGTHANSQMILRLDRGARRLHAFAGVDDGALKNGSVRFSVIGDGSELWNSGIRRKGDPAVPVDVNVSDVQWLTLRVDDADDGISEDHADWAEAVLTGVTRPPVQASRLPGEENTFFPTRLWCDTDGKPIQAHGGGVLYHEKRWWWFGENRSGGYFAIGVSAYVSDDLVNWKHMGVVLPRSAYGGDAKTICERPKVIYNPTTRKFVLWFHYDQAGYKNSRAGVAVADRPEGPYRFLGTHRPVEKSTFRDMSLFVDDDGKAYVFYAAEGNPTMHIIRLNREWTAEEKPMIEGKTWSREFVGKMREAPAPFKHGGKYYVITSACTGWAPNPADLAVADNPLGPYRPLGNPCRGPGAEKTFGGQSTFVLPMPGAPDKFIFMADLWKQKALYDSRYIWLPFQMDGDNTTIEWTDSWKPARNKVE